MTAQLLKVPPTKNTLLQLRRQVDVLEKGHDLLERKRELLTRLVYARIKRYRELRQEAHDAVARAYHWVAMIHMRMGPTVLRQLALGIQPALKLNILPRRALGVQYPSVKASRAPLQPVGLLGTDTSFDRSRKTLADAAVLLAELSEIQMALHRLINEQRKAQKRVNALRYNVIPRYRRTIRYIESLLEEEERDRLFQIRMLRRAR